MLASEISRTALDVEWRRMEICAENLANMNSARVADRPLYRSKTLVSGPGMDFSAHLDQVAPGDVSLQEFSGVAVYEIQRSDLPPRLVREPGNPNADANGMVAYPNIDHAEQMLTMEMASRTYEANLVALNLAREMYSKALSLGGR